MKKYDFSINPPEELSEAAGNIWKETVPILLEKGIGSNADVRQLMMYCVETAMYWQLTSEIVNEDQVVPLKSRDGQIVNYRTNPKIKLRDVCLKNAMLIGTQFGLTPLSVGKIKHKPKREESPEEKNIDKLMKLRKMA